MEVGFFGFIVLILLYLLFRPAVKNTVGAVNDGVSRLALELQEPEQLKKMKAKFGCDDPNVRSMSDLLAWVNSRKNN